jgi:hypothetical protein
MSLESDDGMILTGENRRTQRKTCSSATLSTTNPTWIEPGANPGLSGERLATNDLSHSTALSPNNGFFNQLVDFHGVQQGGHTIGGDLKPILFNPVASPFENGGRSNF